MKKLLLLIVLCLLAYTCSKGEDNSPIAPIKYTVSISASDGGSVSTSGGEYNENTSVSITANPQQGYEFSGWTGTTLTGSSISVKVTSNQTITANFIRSIYTLTIGSVGSGEVTQQVINSARGEDYESGKTIRLTATPENGFLFYDWEQLQNNLSENSYENPLDIVMDQSKTVTATFEQKLPIVNPDNTDKNNTVGKWKIRKKGPGTRRFSDRAVNCELNEIIIRSDNSFTIITETSTITGQYTIDSETSISLNQGETNIGRLTDIILTESFISFNIELTGVCDEQLDADKDPTYDEATDPTAPSNTGSQTTETGSSNLVSDPCTIETEITSENANQTVILGDPIQDIIIEVTVGSTCTETLSVSSSNLPEGVTVSLDNNQITIAGTPISNSNGTQVVFDYDIMLNVASPTSIISGTIRVENDTTTQTNPNQGGGGTATSETNTSTTISSTTTKNCQLFFTFTASDGGMTVDETISTDAGYFSTGIKYSDDPGLEDGSESENCPTNPDFFNTVQVDVNGLPPGVFGDWDPTEQIIVVYGTPESSSIGTHNVEMTATYGLQSISHSFTLTIDPNPDLTQGGEGSDTSGTTTSTTSTTSSDTTDPSTGTNSSTTSSDTTSAKTYVINVTANSATNYILNGTDRNESVTGNDPSVTVNIGDTIDFAVDASGHPFYLKTVQGTGTSDLISDVTNNGATNGTVSWTPSAAGTYYYQCSLHNGMYGTI
ncbi:hypothetical protein N9V42_07085, partial [Flavobacteriaceae bacterium]|nr:hypothetical protein [Flavobacteriaceae bacterium]